MNNKLNYPIIVLPKKDNMIYVFFKENDFRSTSEELLKTIDYPNLDIIDSFGQIFKIIRAFKVKYLGLWGFNPLLKGRQILIDFEFYPEVNQILLNDFKLILINRIEKNRRTWQSGGTIIELKKAISISSSFYEIANLLK
jgi:hypothetical protein